MSTQQASGHRIYAVISGLEHADCCQRRRRQRCRFHQSARLVDPLRRPCAASPALWPAR